MIWIYQSIYENEPGQDKRETEKRLGLELLCRGLQEQYGIDTRSGITIQKGTHGKPYLADYPQIYYNISHTRGLVVCAIGDCEVGIDAEWIRPYQERLLSRVLSEGERMQLERVLPEEKEEVFFRFWTLKESYVKAVGCGISIPLADVSFILEEDGSVGCSEKGCRFWQKKMGVRYIVSVCERCSEKKSFLKEQNSLIYMPY